MVGRVGHPASTDLIDPTQHCSTNSIYLNPTLINQLDLINLIDPTPLNQNFTAPSKHCRTNSTNLNNPTQVCLTNSNNLIDSV